MTDDPRLPAHVEAAALIRQVENAGGFGCVLNRGEREAGTMLVVLRDRGAPARLYERMPSVDGQRKWHLSTKEDVENKQHFSDYIERRVHQDRDAWIIELDIANGERFIGLNAVDD